MLQEMDNMVRKVRQNLKEAEDRHKSYADQKRRHLEFQIGDHFYLKFKVMQEHLPHQASQRECKWTVGQAPTQILKSPWKLLRKP